MCPIWFSLCNSGMTDGSVLDFKDLTQKQKKKWDSRSDPVTPANTLAKMPLVLTPSVDFPGRYNLQWLYIVDTFLVAVIEKAGKIQSLFQLTVLGCCPHGGWKMRQTGQTLSIVRTHRMKNDSVYLTLSFHSVLDWMSTKCYHPPLAWIFFPQLNLSENTTIDTHIGVSPWWFWSQIDRED